MQYSGFPGVVGMGKQNAGTRACDWPSARREMEQAEDIGDDGYLWRGQRPRRGDHLAEGHAECVLER